MNPQYSRYYTYVKPIITNSYVKTYSPLIFSLIAITFFSIFAIRPTVKTILGLQKNINEKQQALNQLTDKVTNLEEGKKNYQKIDPVLIEKVNTLLPTKINLPAFIDELTLLSQTNQASVSGIQFQPIEIDNTTQNVTDPKLNEIAFTLNAQGEYSSLLRTLNSMNYLDRLLSVDDITFTKTDLGTLIMSVNGKVYYLK